MGRAHRGEGERWGQALGPKEPRPGHRSTPGLAVHQPIHFGNIHPELGFLLLPNKAPKQERGVKSLGRVVGHAGGLVPCLVASAQPAPRWQTRPSTWHSNQAAPSHGTTV